MVKKFYMLQKLKVGNLLFLEALHRFCRAEVHNEQGREKTVFRVSDQVRHKQSAQQQKMARGLKFWIKEVEGLYHL